MKKSVFAMLAVATALTAGAQAPRLGIKGGLNIAGLSTTNNEGLSPRFGPHAGILLHGHITPSWAIQPEVIYSAQGSELEFAGTEYKTNLNYLNVPIMLQYMFSNGFRIEAGPQVGLLLNAKIKDPSGETDIKSRFKQADFALGAGLNYLTTSGFGVGGRYNFGLSNINKNTAAAPVKNRVGQISVFYMFDNAHKAKSR